MSLYTLRKFRIAGGTCSARLPLPEENRMLKMKMINIAGLQPVDDPEYRYTMPRIETKIEGRKTVLTNISKVGFHLNREGSEISKFFGYQLGIPATYSAETNRYIVKGMHTSHDLQKLLSRYIEKFVLCESCRLPETYYRTKVGVLLQDCGACGAVHSVDMTHKLSAFILTQANLLNAEKELKRVGNGKKSMADGHGWQESLQKDAAVAFEREGELTEVEDRCVSSVAHKSASDIELTDSEAMSKCCFSLCTLLII
jgi:translation initiation factor 2 beta subunit (eIF-2beta)/eIF-5